MTAVGAHQVQLAGLAMFHCQSAAHWWTGWCRMRRPSHTDWRPHNAVKPHQQRVPNKTQGS